MCSLDQAREVLRDRFGHPDFRPPQDRVIEAALAGRDVLAVLPTGLGKSVCFQVPALLRRGTTLVVSPLISLIEDQVAGARARGIRAFGWTSAAKSEATAAALRAAAAGALDLLYVSPERIARPGSFPALRRTRLASMAIDEAHCISEWGHDFRPSYLELGTAREALGSPPLSALTATATARTRRDIERLLGMSSPVRVLAPGDRPNLWWCVTQMANRGEALRRLVAEIGRAPGAAIVYAGTRDRSARLAIALSRRGLRAAAYHAGLDLERRTWTQARFLDGGIRVICATSAFGMGIDHPRVRLVAHWGAPESIEAYVQEAGRAGRDGEPARCVLLAMDRGRGRERTAGVKETARREAMHEYVEASGCRRAVFAAYFGERAPACAGCDRCGRSVRDPTASASGPGTPAPRRPPSPRNRWRR